MRQLEQLEKKSQKSPIQQTEVMERFSKFLHIHLNIRWLYLVITHSFGYQIIAILAVIANTFNLANHLI